MIILTVQKQKSITPLVYFTRYFLMLNAGFSEEMTKELVLPKGIEDEDEEKVDVMGKKDKRRYKGKAADRSAYKSKDWITHKKDRMRKQVFF